jgi:hypothetical protein
MPNTIPIEQYAITGPEARRAEELLFVGYRKPLKGIATLIRAFADVREMRPGATLRLVGKSPTPELEREWVELADQLGVLGAVVFDDAMDRRGVAAAMSRASVLVHPSVRETFGMTTLEALASGTPVVAARSGGISGLLEDGRLGELVPPFDSRALARAVLRTLDRRDRFDPHVLRAAVEPFSASRVAGRLVDLYEQLAPDPGSAQSPSARPILEARRPHVPPRLLVIANDTERASQLLDGVPSALLSRIVLVSSGHDEEISLPPTLCAVVVTWPHVEDELGRIGLLGPRGALGDRVQRAAMNPLAAIVRRLRPDARARQRTRATIAGIRRALNDPAVRSLLTDGPVPVVCVDAIDHEAASPMTESGQLQVVPGVLWLADVWGGQEAEEMPSRSSTMSASRSPITVQS